MVQELNYLISIRSYLTINASLSITKTMILHIIDYANIFLTGCSQKELDNLQIKKKTPFAMLC